MKNYRYVLFDLDGTLTESGEGIINSAVYALKKSYTDYIRHWTFKLHRRADDIRFTYRKSQAS